MCAHFISTCEDYIYRYTCFSEDIFVRCLPLPTRMLPLFKHIYDMYLVHHEDLVFFLITFSVYLPMFWGHRSFCAPLSPRIRPGVQVSISLSYLGEKILSLFTPYIWTYQVVKGRGWTLMKETVGHLARACLSNSVTPSGGAGWVVLLGGLFPLLHLPVRKGFTRRGVCVCVLSI